MTLPATIIYPKAFEREKSANFDGVFDWTWLCGIFPRAKIKPMDVDASVEINNWFLNFETKAYGRKIDDAQMRAIRAQTRLLHPRFGMPATRYLLLWGKGLCGGEEPTRAWNHCVNGNLWERRKPCKPEHVVRFATVWGMCADRNDFSLLKAAYQHMGLTQPDEMRARPALQPDLFSRGYEQMTHPSLADQIEAVEWAARHIDERESVWPRALRDDAVEDMRLCLLAAVETLKTMEFARATLK
jgi:hypothetical protein